MFFNELMLIILIRKSNQNNKLFVKRHSLELQTLPFINKLITKYFCDKNGKKRKLYSPTD